MIKALMMSESALNEGVTGVAFIERTNPECQVSATPLALASTASLQGRNQGKGKGTNFEQFPWRNWIG